MIYLPHQIPVQGVDANGAAGREVNEPDALAIAAALLVLVGTVFGIYPLGIGINHDL